MKNKTNKISPKDVYQTIMDHSKYSNLCLDNFGKFNDNVLSVLSTVLPTTVGLDTTEIIVDSIREINNQMKTNMSTLNYLNHLLCQQVHDLCERVDTLEKQSVDIPDGKNDGGHIDTKDKNCVNCENISKPIDMRRDSNDNDNIKKSNNCCGELNASNDKNTNDTKDSTDMHFIGHDLCVDDIQKIVQMINNKHHHMNVSENYPVFDYIGVIHNSPERLLAHKLSSSPKQLLNIRRQLKNIIRDNGCDSKVVKNLLNEVNKTLSIVYRLKPIDEWDTNDGRDDQSIDDINYINSILNILENI